MLKFSNIAAVVTAAILLSCSSTKMATTSGGSPNTLTAKEKNDDWQLLFDGQTLNGWHTYGKSSAGSAWKVEDGAICLQTDGQQGYQTRGGGDIVTSEEYSNFHLQLDWKISEKGNSGVVFYVHEDPQFKESWNTGMEMQVLDNGSPTRLGHPDARLYTHRAGDLYDLLASKDAAKPYGEWNHAEIISNNGKLDFYLNGEHTLSTTLWNDTWQQMIAISKFKDMKSFGTYKTGRIALQDHGNNVCFRNIKIRRL